MKCRNCRESALHRQRRQGVLEKYIYPFFGFYPWRCNACTQPGMYWSPGKTSSKLKQSNSRVNDLGEA
jgi:hypothetical protein